VSDLSKLEKFLNDSYRASYLEAHVKGSIAYQIQALRENEGLNQSDFGGLIGKPQSVVSRLEDTEYGGVNVNTLIQIANRLRIGLVIRFCDFPVVLASDVSPDAFKVENIQQTMSRLRATTTAQPTITVETIEARTNTGSGQVWQTTQFPNQPSSQVFPGSATLTTARYTPMPVSADYHPST
jgi:transcriptional regulator with XRE-family HTH domain